jgi:hypothetical protein
MFLVLTTVVFFVLIFFHELSHIVTAKSLKIKVYKVGFDFKPYPHFYVWPSLEHFDYRKKNNIYYFIFSGTFSTILFFIFLLIFSFFHLKFLYYGICIQLTIETNPFFSDFTIAITSMFYGKSDFKNISKNQNYLNNQYIFTKYWYIHFFLWMVLIVVFFSKNMLIRVVL